RRRFLLFQRSHFEDDWRRSPLRKERPMRTASRTLAGSVVLLGLIGPPLRAAEPKLEETELGKLAASLEPGSWGKLKTEGYTADLLRVQSHHILEYTDQAVWDPKSRQVLFVGQGHYSAVKFIAYAAESNRWKQLPTP